jgi:hypothetical protein
MPIFFLMMVVAMALVVYIVYKDVPRKKKDA